MTFDNKSQKLAELLAEIRNLRQREAEVIDAYLNYIGQSLESTFVKWHYAYNILRQNNAVINSLHSGSSYHFSYWLYGENRICRQRLKAQG